MSEPTYFILASLLDGPLHGYAIIKRAEELSGARIRLAVGTLYGALDRLADNGLIVVDREEIVDGRPRRYFTITDDGADAVTQEAKRMAQAARIVVRRRPGTVTS
ncbi:PadR family transcriptional regulator [Actinomadura sp. DC4]|uniref:PadR family transcriptional regulator n=1 Tax=Actinomadura sp. DC4 TaxID=3055069 RepID=UPI0025AF8572|nr:PadR family transcriptional regulator [Actinomadura sp. DC4]MDN3355601.1 PadR family transcriptional regulator [Actinomadura sp. DC4]